jgi:transglutaminase-like putative cysteine protease
LRYRITHSTRYDYKQPVLLSHNVVRLRPRSYGAQTCLLHRLTILPAPARRSERLDYFGNYSDYFCLQESHRNLTVASQSEVEVRPSPRVDLTQGPSWERVRELLLDPLEPEALSAREFSFDSPYVARSAALAAYADTSFAPGRPFLEGVWDLTNRIHREFKFLPGSTKVGTPVLDVLSTRQGVCQDFSHVQIGCLRSLGLAARYVSGYLVTRPPPGKPRLTGADVSHAWVSVFDPATGWIDFDPTNGVMPSDGHITVAWGRDYSDVGPIQGILVGGRRHELKVSVDVLPEETPT